METLFTGDILAGENHHAQLRDPSNERRAGGHHGGRKALMPVRHVLSHGLLAPLSRLDENWTTMCMLIRCSIERFGWRAVP